MLKRLTSAAVDVIYPPKCLACTEPTDAPNGLCPACWRDTHFIFGSACCKCGVPLVGDSENGELCETCQRFPPAWDRGVAAMLYQGAGRRIVLALKHGDRLDTVPTLAGWLARAGSELLNETDLIVPVPLHWRRLLKRRYNQSAELCRRLSAISGQNTDPRLLIRRRFTTPQEKMDRTTRSENQAGAIAVRPGSELEVKGKTVTVVDDVLTTGATLSACAEVLRYYGATQINVVVLCRVAYSENSNI